MSQRNVIRCKSLIETWVLECALPPEIRRRGTRRPEYLFRPIALCSPLGPCSIVAFCVKIHFWENCCHRTVLKPLMPCHPMWMLKPNRFSSNPKPTGHKHPYFYVAWWRAERGVGGKSDCNLANFFFVRAIIILIIIFRVVPVILFFFKSSGTIVFRIFFNLSLQNNKNRARLLIFLRRPNNSWLLMGKSMSP